MEFARLLLVSFVMSIAPLIGYIISFYTKEEIVSGEKYLKTLQRLILLILALALIVRRIEVYFAAIIILSIVFFYIIDSSFLFLSFATLLFTSAFYGSLFNFSALLVFLYFIFYGLLCYQKKLKDMLLYGAVFLVAVLVLCGFWNLAF